MARPTLYDHRKFRRLVRSLQNEALALGSLEFMWSVAYQSGEELLGESIDVEGAARWVGEPGTLTDALHEAGFIDRREDGLYYVHDLYDHAPEYVRKRMDREAARREAGTTLRELRADAARKRWKKKRKNKEKEQTAASGNHLLANGSKRRANGTTPAPAPAPAPALKKETTPSADASGLCPFLDHAKATWEAAADGPVPWTDTEWKLLTRCFKRNFRGDSARAIAAWDRFMADTSPYFAGHSPKKFAGDPGRWVEKKRSVRRVDGDEKAVCRNCGLDDGPPIRADGYHDECRRAAGRSA